MRQWTAAGLLVLAALVSIYQAVDLSALRINTRNGPLLALERARCLVDALPQGVQRFGYLPAVELVVTPRLLAIQDPQMSMGAQFQRFYMARYAVTPRLVTQSPDQPWVIASFPDRQSGLRAIGQGDWEIVKDCQNGVFLLHH